MKFAIAAIASLILAGAAAAQEPITDLTGRHMVVVDAEGQTHTIHYEADGVARAAMGDNETVGRWEIANGQLCFEFSGQPRDCWPWDGNFPTGQAVPVTSPRGEAFIITLN